MKVHGQRSSLPSAALPAPSSQPFCSALLSGESIDGRSGCCHASSGLAGLAEAARHKAAFWQHHRRTHRLSHERLAHDSQRWGSKHVHAHPAWNPHTPCGVEPCGCDTKAATPNNNCSRCSTRRCHSAAASVSSSRCHHTEHLVTSHHHVHCHCGHREQQQCNAGKALLWRPV